MMAPDRSGTEGLDDGWAFDADACAEALAETRLTTLPQHFTAAGSGLYLLIDPMLGDPVVSTPPDEGLAPDALNAIRADAWARPTFTLKVPAGLAFDAALAPYLVELQGPADPWMDVSVHWAVQETVQSWVAEPGQPTPHRVGGWLQAAAFGPQLAQALSGCLQLSTQAHTSTRYLRLADRRVLSLAVHVLSTAVAAKNLSFLQHWHWLDSHAAWCSLSAPANGAPERRSLPLATFSAEQWAQMAQGPVFHARMADQIRQRLAQHDSVHPAQWRPVSADQWRAVLTHVQSGGATESKHSQKREDLSV